MDSRLVDFFSTERHYRRCLRPVRHALGPSFGRWHTSLPSLAGDGPPVLVASGGDALQVIATSPRPVALMQHGAGQSYNGCGPSNLDYGYVGGAGLDGVGLFLAHTWRDAVEWEAAYPDRLVEVVGSPVPADEVRTSVRRRAEPVPVVGVTFHWRCTAQLEAGTAWPEWRRPVLALREAGFRLLGHEHPRWGGRLMRWWETAGVETTDDPDDLLARSSVLVADNTSLLYEAMACGVPTVGLRSHRWRRDVEHGLRFWQYAPPVDLDPGADLVAAVRAQAAFGPRADERAIARAVLGPPDGLAASRVADALARWAALVY